MKDVHSVVVRGMMLWECVCGERWPAGAPNPMNGWRGQGVGRTFTPSESRQDGHGIGYKPRRLGSG